MGQEEKDDGSRRKGPSIENYEHVLNRHRENAVSEIRESSFSSSVGLAATSKELSN